jgi:thiamine monophosphate synthase
VDEAKSAAGEGADFLLAGMTYPSASHPGLEAKGTAFIGTLVPAGAPVIAIGGITPERAVEVHAAGAWGVAAIRSIWEADDPAAAVLAMLEPWEES